MFKNANAVSRVDKARILGFMTGIGVNSEPNTDNVIVIKLSANEVRKTIFIYYIFIRNI